MEKLLKKVYISINEQDYDEWFGFVVIHNDTVCAFFLYDPMQERQSLLIPDQS